MCTVFFVLYFTCLPSDDFYFKGLCADGEIKWSVKLLESLIKMS